MVELRRHAGDHLAIDVPDQGMHLTAYLRRRRSDVEVERAAGQHGVVARAIQAMYKKARTRSGLMLGFSRFSREAIIPAAARLAMIIHGNGK